MYSKIKVSIKTQNLLTDSILSTTGVRQGDNLSPQLFNLYVNDLPNQINTLPNTDPITLGTSKVSCLLYADDIVLLSTSRQGLQKCIDCVKTFSNTWHMEVNLNKTKVLIFNKSGEHINEDLYYGPEKIECTESYAYLGIEFHCSGSTQKAIQKLYEKGLKALFKLNKLIQQSFDIPTIIHIFDHTIAPILLYASEVWGIYLAKTKQNGVNNDYYLEKHLENNALTKLEIKFYRQLLKVKRNAPILAIRGELGRHPITIKAINRSIKYYNQIISKPSNCLVRQALDESISLHEKGNKSWFTKLTNTKRALDLPNLPSGQTKYEIKKSSKGVERKIKINYEDFWSNEINKPMSKGKGKGGNKLRTYNKLKQDFATERYLSLINNTSHRCSLTQLRISSHYLNIESMRGTIQDPSERTCTLCDMGKTEDEFHFLTECPSYRHHRDALLSKIDNQNINNLNTEERALWLLTNEDKEVCQALGKFIFDCFTCRKENLRAI